MNAVSDTLALALMHHRRGEWQQAKTLYEQILQQHPQHAEATHWLGMVAHQTAQYEQAIPLLRRAVELQPSSCIFHNNLGLCLRTVGDLDGAIASYRKALEVSPEESSDRQGVLDNLTRATFQLVSLYSEIGQHYFQEESYADAARMDFRCAKLVQGLGRVAAAERYYRAALTLYPEYAEAHYQLAELYFAGGHVEAAIAHCRQAIHHQPNYAEAYKLVGNCFLHQKNGDAALQAYTKAVEYQPNFAEAYANIGNLYVNSNQVDRAIAYYRKALQCKPDLLGVYWSLGNALERKGEIDEAIACWQRFDGSGTGIDADGCYRTALKLTRHSKTDLALEYFRKAIAKQPDMMQAHWDYCEVLGNSNDLSAARAASDRALAVCSDARRILTATMAIKIYLKSGLSEPAKERFRAIEPTIYQRCHELQKFELVKVYLNLLFDVPHLRDDVPLNARLCKHIAHIYGQHLDRDIQEYANLAATNHRVPATPLEQRPLRIGVLSRHFRRHSVGWCSADILQALKRYTPHIYLYVTGSLVREDDRTQQFQQLAARFYRPTVLNGDNAYAKDIVEQIVSDRIDVLVDMDSLTVRVHPEILRSHPAPVCVSWLGYDAPYMSDRNYYLGDWYTHPAGVEPHYMEKVIRLPHTFAAVSGLGVSEVDRVSVRQGMRIGQDQVAYLCVALGFKFSQEMVEAQVRILKRVPNSVLFHKARLGDDNVMQRVYREECDRQGVNFTRLRFLPRTRHEEDHRAIYHISDVLLDSYPYNGGTHTVEALWCNLPVVTRVGQQSFARMGYSLLSCGGMDDIGIAWSTEEYVERAVRLGLDANLRQAVRQKLMQAKQPESLAPLWNPQQFARNFYEILNDLYQKATMFQ